MEPIWLDGKLQVSRFCSPLVDDNFSDLSSSFILFLSNVVQNSRSEVRKDAQRIPRTHVVCQRRRICRRQSLHHQVESRSSAVYLWIEMNGLMINIIHLGLRHLSAELSKFHLPCHLGSRVSNVAPPIHFEWHCVKSPLHTTRRDTAYSSSCAHVPRPNRRETTVCCRHARPSCLFKH